MENQPICTICGMSARLCQKCRSAAYCSVECQQADWRTHKLLCRQFKDLSAASFAVRPSPTHYLAIYFPMTERRPRLIWVDTEEVNIGRQPEEEGYFNSKLDALLHIPGNDRYIGRNLHCIRGNLLRGRERNDDTLNIWYLDDAYIKNFATNQSIHGTVPTLIGDTWGEKIWKGPMVAVMKAGHAFDPRRVIDITLTGYRDAIDYLGYYRDENGSMVDGVGSLVPSARVILAERLGKVKGVRINCVGGQIGRAESEFVQVDVPKTHPLFNLEGDDPLSIPEVLGWSWVAKRYGDRGKAGGCTESGDNEALISGDNPLARRLLTQATLQSGDWGGVRSWWQDPLGSILIVNRNGYDLDVRTVRGMCAFIEQVVAPLMTEERGQSQSGRQEVIDAITEDNLAPFIGLS